MRALLTTKLLGNNRQTMVHNISLTETETEYLLKIPASQKERAKSIPQYRWDASRVCWVYPKTVKSYDALIEEFGDDLVRDLKIKRPDKNVPIKPEDLQAENRGLKETLSEIRKTLELLTRDSSSRRSETQELRSALAAKEEELAGVLHRFRDLEKQLKDREFTVQELSKDVQRLRAENKRFQEESKKQPDRDSQQGIHSWIRGVAKAGSDYDEKFCLVVERLRLDGELSAQVGIELESELRNILRPSERNLTSYDLMKQAEDAGILDQRASDLAHLIRKQRNLSVHEITSDRCLKARGLLCLFAASLLWKELPKQGLAAISSPVSNDFK